MGVKVILIVLMLGVALIGVFTSKDLPKKIMIALLVLLCFHAAFSIYDGWRSKAEEAKTQAKQATSGALDGVTRSQIERGKRRIHVGIGQSGTRFVFEINPKQKVFRPFQPIEALEWIPLWLSIAGDRIKVTTDIRDAAGNIIAKLSENEWQINKNNTFDRNYTDHALEVIDNKDEVVLQLILLDDMLQVQARFFNSKGESVTIVEHPGKKTGLIVFGSPGNEPEGPKMSRIFKYPSSLHLGERATSD